jgi:mannose-6-phosphate isomerase-like protein (cupin superfamily)
MDNPFVSISPTVERAPRTYISKIQFSTSVPFKGSTWFMVEPGAQSILDQHSVTECWWICEGKGLLSYGAHSYEITPNDVLLICPNVPHTVKNVGSVTLKLVSIWW